MANLALYLTCLVLGILPVIAFLIALVLLDSYKLVRFRWVLGLLATGGLLAAIAGQINPALIDALGIPALEYRRYVGPPVEELLKGLVIAVAIARSRIGFLVDAAVWGFAIGAGFAAVENIHYFVVLGEPNLTVWMIRGFGTAIMHGGATSLMAVSSQLLTDRHDSVRPRWFVPGFVLATAVHSFFNHFVLSPRLSTLLLLVFLPFLFVLVFRASEKATHSWLAAGFDSDQELLEVIRRGEFSESRLGDYLKALKRQFPPEVVADMLCLIRLHLELSIRAKGVLLMQKAGFEAPADPEVDARFDELRYLERSVGPTGRLALAPIFSMSSRDLWQFHTLGRR